MLAAAGVCLCHAELPPPPRCRRSCPVLTPATFAPLPQAEEPDNVVISVGVNASGATTWFMATKPDEQLTAPVAFLVAFTQAPAPAAEAAVSVGVVPIIPGAATPAAEQTSGPAASARPAVQLPVSTPSVAGGPAATIAPSAGGMAGTSAEQPLTPVAAGTSVQLRPLAPGQTAGPAPQAESATTTVPAAVVPGLPGLAAEVPTQPAPASEAQSAPAQGPEGWTPRRATIAPAGTLAGQCMGVASQPSKPAALLLCYACVYDFTPTDSASLTSCHTAPHFPAGGACLQLTNSEIAGQVVLGTSAANSSFDCCAQMLRHPDANVFSFCPIQKEGG